MERIGILGGTFDPPHYGHLLLGEIASQQLSLDRVLFMPAGAPPHKPERDLTADDLRLQMVALAIQGNERFAVDDLDMRRPPPHYTVTLMKQLRDRFPEAQLWLLAGSDSLADLPNWREPVELVQLCRLAILPRPDSPVSWDELERSIPALRTNVDWLEGPSYQLSSTQIRHLRREGRTVRYMLPDAVRLFLETNELYGTTVD
ncbi:MAG: nicotinate-nucleotide adenylyltransferase [Candidatus Promineifilaceae bacterium]|nr:nicotinate-nucleotide adenylyltransferase [Candidatus Promineifilaceae bacterium]